MNCDRIRPLLSLYVDGQAGLLDTARVEEHLQECEACRAEVFDLRQSAAALRRLPSGDPGPEFNAKVMAEYTKRSTRLKSTTSLHMRLAMGFACLLLLIAVAIPVYVAGMRHFAGRQDI